MLSSNLEQAEYWKYHKKLHRIYGENLQASYDISGEERIGKAWRGKEGRFESYVDFWCQWCKWNVSAAGSYIRKDMRVWCLFNTLFSFPREQVPGWKCTLNPFYVE